MMNLREALDEAKILPVYTDTAIIIVDDRDFMQVRDIITKSGTPVNVVSVTEARAIMNIMDNE